MHKGFNLQTIKLSNRATILYLLNDRGLLSRKQIAELTGLTRAAVTKITQSLLDEGLIEEKDSVGSGLGRKEVLLALKLSSFKALGVTFERGIITMSIASLDGTLIESDTVESPMDFEKIKALIKEYYDKKKIKYNLIGAGVSAIGLEKYYGLWPNRDLKQEAETIFDIPVFIKNNVRAFSTAELIYGGGIGEESVLVFKWGPGIGSAFIKDGRVLHGEENGSTEIGHTIINLRGKPCRCGRRGCIETETALDEIKKEVLELGYDISIEEILESNDKKIKEVVDGKIMMVCFALMNASTVLDVNKVILFGSVFKIEGFLERFERKWNDFQNNVKKTIELSSINDKSSYIGSMALVAKKLFFEKGV